MESCCPEFRFPSSTTVEQGLESGSVDTPVSVYTGSWRTGSVVSNTESLALSKEVKLNISFHFSTTTTSCTKPAKAIRERLDPSDTSPGAQSRSVARPRSQEFQKIVALDRSLPKAGRVVLDVALLGEGLAELACTVYETCGVWRRVTTG